ncbi:g9633 [Coccomyxa elongata]
MMRHIPILSGFKFNTKNEAIDSSASNTRLVLNAKERVIKSEKPQTGSGLGAHAGGGLALGPAEVGGGGGAGGGEPPVANRPSPAGGGGPPEGVAAGLAALAPDGGGGEPPAANRPSPAGGGGPPAAVPDGGGGVALKPPPDGGGVEVSAAPPAGGGDAAPAGGGDPPAAASAPDHDQACMSGPQHGSTAAAQNSLELLCTGS